MKHVQMKQPIGPRLLLLTPDTVFGAMTAQKARVPFILVDRHSDVWLIT